MHNQQFFFKNFSRKSLVVQIFAVPLHSLSTRNAVNWVTESSIRSLKTFHTDIAVQRSSIELPSGSENEDCSIYKVQEQIRTVNKLLIEQEKIVFTSLYTIESGQHQTDNKLPWEAYKNKIIQRRVWSWLRMNASYRLNTCKSRGLLRQTTGARVSNAYPTCPSHWHSLSKERLIPNNIVELPDSTMKAPAERDGDAFH